MATSPKKINEPAGTNWASALLDLLGAPRTAQNYQFVNAWATREHGPSYPKSLYANNPFFTTAGGSGSAGPVKAGLFPLIPGSAFKSGVNTAGVPAYPDITTGDIATAYTLGQQYPGIITALRSGHPEQYANNAEFQKELSTWSGGGYGALNVTSQPAAPVGPTLQTPIEGVSAADFWSGKGGGVVIGTGLGAGAIAGGVTASSLLGLGGAEAAGAGAAGGAGAGSALTKLLSGAAGKTGFAAFLTYMAAKYGDKWLIRGAEMLGGGVLILLGLIIIVLGGRGTPAAQTRRAVGVVR